MMNSTFYKRTLKALFLLLLVLLLPCHGQSIISQQNGEAHVDQHQEHSLQTLESVTRTTTTTRPEPAIRHLRSITASNQQRQLPGNEFDMKTWSPAETGTVSGIAFLLVILFVLYCCCGCSLCNILAILCCWEICCDPN